MHLARVPFIATNLLRDSIRTDRRATRMSTCTGGSTNRQSFKWRLSTPVTAKQHHPFVFESWIIKRAQPPFIGMVDESNWQMEVCLFLSQPPIMPGENVWFMKFTPPDPQVLFFVSPAHETASNKLGNGWLAALYLSIEGREARLRCESGYLVWKTGTSKTMALFTARPTTKLFVWDAWAVMTDLTVKYAPPNDVPAGVHSGAFIERRITPWCMTWIVNGFLNAQLSRLMASPIAHQRLLRKHLIAPGIRLDLCVNCVQSKGGRNVTLSA